MQQHAARSAQHVYNQHQLDPSGGYGQHLVSGGQVPTSLHQLGAPQQQPPGGGGVPGGLAPTHPSQQPSHLPPQSQQQQLHQSHNSQPQQHPQQHPGLSSLGGGPQSSQQQQQQGQHPGMVHPGAQQSNAPGGGLHGLGGPLVPQQQHPMTHGAGMPGVPGGGGGGGAGGPGGGYGASAPQQQSYLPNAATKQQPTQHGGSPQYRAPFPQLSPQMSPRPPQMSPHTQMSPRPVMSPAKPPGGGPPVVTSQSPQATITSTHSPHLGAGIVAGSGGMQSPRPQTGTKLTASSSGGSVISQLNDISSLIPPVSQTSMPVIPPPSATGPPGPQAYGSLDDKGQHGVGGVDAATSVANVQQPVHSSSMMGNTGAPTAGVPSVYSHDSTLTPLVPSGADVGDTRQQQQTHQHQQHSLATEQTTTGSSSSNEESRDSIVPAPAESNTDESKSSNSNSLMSGTDFEALHHHQQQNSGTAGMLLGQDNLQVGGTGGVLDESLKDASTLGDGSTLLDGAKQAGEETLGGYHSDGSMMQTGGNTETSAMDQQQQQMLLDSVTTDVVAPTGLTDLQAPEVTTATKSPNATLVPTSTTTAVSDSTISPGGEPIISTSSGTGLLSGVGGQPTNVTGSATTYAQALSGQIPQSMTGSAAPGSTLYGMHQVGGTMMQQQQQQMQGVPVAGQTVTGGGDMMVPPPPPPYQTPSMMSHSQERAAIKQQMQDMYKLPMADNQEKMMRLQERLAMLQQHEAADGCQGLGPQPCLLMQPPHPLYPVAPTMTSVAAAAAAAMIDSPQVTSTTGRGRGRTPSSKPRKPRAKKGDKLLGQQEAAAAAATVVGQTGLITSGDETSQSNVVAPFSAVAAATGITTPTPTTLLPVSEDSVTAGTGLPEVSPDGSSFHELMSLESSGGGIGVTGGGDLSQDNLSCSGTGDLDTSTDASGKKIKKPRKPREPKKPAKGAATTGDGVKEPTPKKESKKKESKESKKKKKKIVASSDGDNSLSMEDELPDGGITAELELSKSGTTTSETDENQSLASLMNAQNSNDANAAAPSTAMAVESGAEEGQEKEEDTAVSTASNLVESTAKEDIDATSSNVAIDGELVEEKEDEKIASATAKGEEPEGEVDGDEQSKAAITTTSEATEGEGSGMPMEEVTDFDDIPVSKISKSELTKDEQDKKDTQEEGASVEPEPETPTKSKSKKSSKKSKEPGSSEGGSSSRNRSRPSGGGSSSSRRSGGSKSSGGGSKSRSRRSRMIVTESDGEGDDLLSTPPPSPPPDTEADSSKRRSARNTQRKKYVDDVMLRFSDDESGIISPTPTSGRKDRRSDGGSDRKEGLAPTDVSVTSGEAGATVPDGSVVGASGEAASTPGTGSELATDENKVSTSDATKLPAGTAELGPDGKPLDDASKPNANYVYVNTSEEDSMVVQYVLAVRKGKRELKPDPPPPPPKEKTPEPAEGASEEAVKGEPKEEETLKAEGNEASTTDAEVKEETKDLSDNEKEKEKEQTADTESKENEHKEDTSAADTAAVPMETDVESNSNADKIATDATDAEKPSETEQNEATAELSKTDERMETDEQEAAAEKLSPPEEVKDKTAAVETDEQEKESTDVVKEKMEIDEEPPKTAATEDTTAVEDKSSAQPNGAEELPAQAETDKETLSDKKAVSSDENVEKMEEDEVSAGSEKKHEEQSTTEEVVKKEGSDEAEASSEKSGGEVAIKEEQESAVTEEEKKPEPVFIDVEEYFVKYRNFSYLHCEWRTEDELLKGDKRVGNKIKRFLMKQQQQLNIFESLDEEPFNPDFVEVDRVLDVSELVDDEGKTVKHYLVKWKSLPYEDSTWELEDDVDQLKIEQYYKFNKIPPKSEWKTKKRPHPDQWKALPESPTFKGGNKLRPYQLEGLNWLRYSWYKGNNCILADEMGLGKTIQSLTFVNSVYEYGIRGPFLVIAPLSTIPNWQREFEGWTEMNVIVYHGSATSRQMIQDYEVYYRTETGKLIRDITKFNVLITTFEMIVTDYQDLKNFTWRACVIDEAHRLKNRNCKLLEGLRQLNLEHRVLLSGTPLQNNVNELFSLLNFLEPSQFACSEEFLREFGSLKTESEVLKLQALLKPMMLRRLKDDVEKSLAPKEETIVEVELTNIQKKYYRGILEQNFSFLMKGTTSANIPNLMNTMMELRKCCIHPYLLNGAEDQIQYDYRQQHGEDAESYYKNLIVSSGKMVLIDKLLPKLRANGHRVLIFSQMVRCLDILEDYLMYKKYPFERIDGRIRGNLRQAAIDRYSKPDSDRFVFLLCTKAGGLGINLTAADTVIIYDSDWNPQNDLQAQARCHRIGQQKMVKIYRLLCRNTYEREMFDKASLKLGLDKAVLQSMNTGQNKDGTQRQLSKKEIEDLLKKGAYGAVMDDDAGDKFCEEDIDSILLRRTQVITMESEKGSTFSKASFAASANRSDINIDDPDFWNKWAKKAEIDPTACEKDETEDLVIAEPRRRTQIKRYGHDDGVMDISDESSGEQGSDGEEGGIGLKTRSKRTRGAKERKKLQQQMQHDDYVPRDRETLAVLGADEVSYGNWARSECFKVEKGLLSHGWARWTEILEQGQFKRGWREQDVEDCARVILLYCLERYQGDEKIKNFIWDLITPNEGGEQREIARNHSGLHNLVPRGRNAKGRKSSSACTTPKRETSNSAGTGSNGGGSPVVAQPAGSTTPAPQCSGTADANEDASSNSSGTKAEKSAKSGSDTGGTTTPVSDPHHWSKDEKYDTETLLDINYKKHLTRHANKVLLRVRMLYYIKHEVLGDLVNQINEGANASDLPIRPPPTPDQLPCSWWNPNCCDRSLLVGTYKHGCENYRGMRADPMLCFQSHCGPGDGTIEEATIVKENDDDANSKLGDNEEDPEDGVPSETTRSASVGIESKDDDEESTVGTASAAPTPAPSDMNPELVWPSMQDLNTRLRRVITSYQRNYKKEELKQQQKAKGKGVQQQQQQQLPSTSGNSGSGGLQAPTAGMPTAADFSLMLSLGLGLNPADPNQLANIDLQKLAMYLKMERREKNEQVMRERERVRLDQIPKRWTRREENEFIRVLTGYGIDLQPNTTVPTPDWSRFKVFAKLDKKTDENLSDFYKVFIAMCKRQAGVKLSDDEKGLEGLVDDVTEDHAKLILDRLELLSKARQIVKHPKLEENIRLCENNLDTPDWWIPGRHDRELLRAVLKYGIYRSEQLILADSEFPFYESAKKYLQQLEMQIQLQNQQLLKMQAEAAAAQADAAVAKATAEVTASSEKVVAGVNSDMTSVKKEKDVVVPTTPMEVDEEKVVSDALPKVELVGPVSPVKKEVEEVSETKDSVTTAKPTTEITPSVESPVKEPSTTADIPKESTLQESSELSKEQSKDTNNETVEKDSPSKVPVEEKLAEKESSIETDADQSVSEKETVDVPANAVATPSTDSPTKVNTDVEMDEEAKADESSVKLPVLVDDVAVKSPQEKKIDEANSTSTDDKEVEEKSEEQGEKIAKELPVETEKESTESVENGSDKPEQESVAAGDNKMDIDVASSEDKKTTEVSSKVTEPTRSEEATVAKEDEESVDTSKDSGNAKEEKEEKETKEEKNVEDQEEKEQVTEKMDTNDVATTDSGEGEKKDSDTVAVTTPEENEAMDVEAQSKVAEKIDDKTEQETEKEPDVQPMADVAPTEPASPGNSNKTDDEKKSEVVAPESPKMETEMDSSKILTENKDQGETVDEAKKEETPEAATVTESSDVVQEKPQEEAALDKDQTEEKIEKGVDSAADIAPPKDGATETKEATSRSSPVRDSSDNVIPVSDQPEPESEKPKEAVKDIESETEKTADSIAEKTVKQEAADVATEVVEAEKTSDVGAPADVTVVEAAKQPAARSPSPDVIIVEEKKPIEVKAVVNLTDEERCTQQTAALKARFPDLEVFQPLMKLKQLDNSLTKEDLKNMSKFASMIDTSMIVKWFRDFALERRVGHIIYCVEHGEWPVGKSYSAYTGCLGIDLDIPLYETIKRIIPVNDEVRRSASSTPDVITITTDHQNAKQISNQAAAIQQQSGGVGGMSSAGGSISSGSSVLGAASSSAAAMNHQSMSVAAAAHAAAAHAAAAAAAGVAVPPASKKRKRHIAIDVETERAKLHALLNNTQSPVPSGKTQPSHTATSNSGSGSGLQWNDDDVQEVVSSRNNARSGSNSANSNVLQPPPAHQHGPRNQMSYPKPTLIPGTSSTLTPIDLSSSYSLPKVNIADMIKSSSGMGGSGGPMDLSEVQDFSIGKNKKSSNNQLPSGISITSASGPASSMMLGHQHQQSPSAAVAAAAAAGKGKLNDMLSKLMKKNNVSVPIEEPPLGKEKKR
uniref:DNA helicase n=1 Tax=Anopheles culicifacies TaxID=139723 RepID=A0A182LWG1_9DIPT